MFYHKRVLLILLMAFSAMSMSATIVTCPSVTDLKQGHFHYWLPLYKIGEELASDSDVEKFKAQVVQFESGQWDSDYLESGHCFYQGVGVMVNDIIFAQDAWRPQETVKWIWRDFLSPHRHAECHSSEVLDCGFIK